jgi:hypothetical protein
VSDLVVAVTGGESFAREPVYADDVAREADKPRMLRDLRLCFSSLNQLQSGGGISLLLLDGVSGATNAAAQWASTWNVRCERARSDPATFGRSAARVRRDAFVALLGAAGARGVRVAVVTFPGGDGELAEKARAAGIEVIDCEY